MSSRSEERDRLSRLTDDELLAECVRLLGEYRRAYGGGTERVWYESSNLGRDECLDRGKRDIWTQAKAQEKAEFEERRLKPS